MKNILYLFMIILLISCIQNEEDENVKLLVEEIIFNHIAKNEDAFLLG